MPRSARAVAAGMLFLLLLALLPLAPVFAQSQSAGGEIEGMVTAPDGTGLPGVRVTIRNQETGLVRETTTDEAGRYRAPLLPVGTYEVTADLEGFPPVRRTNLTLTIGSTLKADVAFEPSA